jgi:hypothetical protein
MHASRLCLALFCMLSTATMVGCRSGSSGIGSSTPTVPLGAQFTGGFGGYEKTSSKAAWKYAVFTANSNSMPYCPACGSMGADGTPSAASLFPMIQSSQHPDFGGVWQLRAAAGAPSKGMSLLWISQKDSDLDLKMFSQFEKRYGQAEAVFTIGKERRGIYVRMPAKFTANWDGEALTVGWTATWPWGDQTEHHRLTLNASATELTDTASDQFGDRIRQHTAVYDREPLETAKVFGYAEQSAGEHYKNIQIVKDIPETALTPLMATFQTALGVQCEYCHNQSAYDSDKSDKKLTARKMLSMVADLNHREFGGQQAVTCFTCHRGKEIPDRSATEELK